MKKKKYLLSEMDIIEFDVEDVIEVSPPSEDQPIGDDNPPPAP